MQLAIYRSATHTLYPEESLTYFFAFQPIRAEEQTRDDRLMSWTDDSGTRPFAVIEIPEDCRITQAEGGWRLLIPETSSAIDADRAFELAMSHCHGFTFVEAPRYSVWPHNGES